MSTTVEKEKHEREELQTKNQTLSTDLEKGYEEIKELKQKNLLLEEVKSSLTRKNEENVTALNEYRNSIDKLTAPTQLWFNRMMKPGTRFQSCLKG